MDTHHGHRGFRAKQHAPAYRDQNRALDTQKVKIKQPSPLEKKNQTAKKSCRSLTTTYRDPCGPFAAPAAAFDEVGVWHGAAAGGG